MAVSKFQFVGGSSLDDFNGEMSAKVQDYKNNMAVHQNDWNWFDHHSCEKHGKNCSSGALEVKTNGAINRLTYTDTNIKSCIHNQLADFPLKVKSELKALGSRKGMAFDDSFLKEYTVNGVIKRLKYFLAWCVNDVDKTITIFNFTAKIEKSAGSDHHFLASYYERNDNRIENALNYHIANVMKEKFPQLF